MVGSIGSEKCLLIAFLQPFVFFDRDQNIARTSILGDHDRLG